MVASSSCIKLFIVIFTCDNFSFVTDDPPVEHLLHIDADINAAHSTSALCHVWCTGCWMKQCRPKPCTQYYPRAMGTYFGYNNAVGDADSGNDYDSDDDNDPIPFSSEMANFDSRICVLGHFVCKSACPRWCCFGAGTKKRPAPPAPPPPPPPPPPTSRWLTNIL